MGLELDNILGSDEIENLFSDETSTEPSGTEEKPVENVPEGTEENKEVNKATTEVVDPNELFEEEKPESVGSVEDKQEGASSEKGSGDSPYSSIASALKEEGILPDLDDETVSKISTPEDFAEALEKQVQAKFDARQKRIDDALNSGIEVSEIKNYESTLTYLDSIKEESLSEEGDKGENLRKQLIYQDFRNRGYSDERAKREVQKSFSAGTDVEDAKEALGSNKEFFNNSYQELVDAAKEEESKYQEQRKEQASQLKKSILEDDKVFGSLVVDKPTRQKVLDSISKPVYKDPDTGEYLTAIQKYESENKVEFLKNLGLVFTLTNGFKDFNGLIKGPVKKEISKGIRSLEHVLKNTSKTVDGNLRLAGGVSDNDPETYIGKGIKLDI